MMLNDVLFFCSSKLQLALVKADLIPQLINTLYPLSLSLTKAVDISSNLISCIRSSAWLVTPGGLEDLEIEAPDEQQAIHETVLQQVVVPSEKTVSGFYLTRHSVCVIVVGSDLSSWILSLNGRRTHIFLRRHSPTSEDDSEGSEGVVAQVMGILDPCSVASHNPTPLCLCLTTHTLPLPSASPSPPHPPTPLCLCLTTHTLPLPSASPSPPHPPTPLCLCLTTTPSHSPLPLPHHPHPPTPSASPLTIHSLPLPSAFPLTTHTLPLPSASPSPPHPPTPLCLCLTTTPSHSPLPLPHHHTLPLPSASPSPPHPPTPLCLSLTTTPSHSPLPLPHHPHPPSPDIPLRNG
ncbi:hypothetical protein BLNAU_9276 [Blattamonas nauphoetae]|uniref:Uncharacterized protein n=1 Tax=Blattamonas nauphoetae TaxID=2049346 RepID=A0ABQ9XW84_9EUKA|nr:hypothetical protein BLNAU_9276 [Blattamonas nauphoetae]